MPAPGIQCHETAHDGTTPRTRCYLRIVNQSVEAKAHDQRDRAALRSLRERRRKCRRVACPIASRRQRNAQRLTLPSTLSDLIS